ncbi:hypothetical protein L3Y34_014056 [Caenorhabditis briggsae]|uniref:DZF domain-containing protein n=1 Tax=Caenorhabditis briggsae TaxID=6238 RepID=A0AAE9DSL9_CAEBR|nr:hypothetical protein L3Y34_014056 [Caenorhabditis briggsae]
MYGGYQGAYGAAYGNQQYSAAAANTYQQQQQQPYYQGVNPYANYGFAAAAALPPPPPPPPVPSTDYTAANFSSFPSQGSVTAPSAYFKKAGAAQNDYSAGFNGYDAAVYNYAQQTTASSTKSTWQQHQQRGGGAMGGGGVRYGKPSSGDNKEYYCDTCKISCAGGITYKEHLDGKNHKKREESLKKGTPVSSLAKNKLTYRCELCNVTCTGQDTYMAHVKGGKHQKTASLHRKLGKYVPEDVPTIIAPGADGPIETKAKPKWHQHSLPGGKKVVGINTVQFVGGHKLNSTGQLEEKKREVALAVSSVGKSTPPAEIEVEDERVREMMRAEEVQAVGLDYVLEERDATGKLTQFNCTLCDCKFSDPNAKDVHVKGRRHRMAYKTKVDSSLVVDPKPASQKKSKKQQSEQPTVFPERLHLFSAPVGTSQEAIIIDERTVTEKLKSLEMGEEFYKSTERMIGELLGMFRAVSERAGYMETDGLTDPKLIVMGNMFVGNLARKTFLSYEELVAEFVMQTTPVPTEDVVKKVLEAVRGVTEPAGFSFDVDPTSPIRLLGSVNYNPAIKIRVSLATSLFSNKEELAKSDFAHKMACVDLNTQVRRQRWWEQTCRPLLGFLAVVRLLRDARSRHPVWSLLNDHQLDLIVHNLIGSTSIALTQSEALKLVLEAFSGGYLFNAILVDPCEISKVNVLDVLTDQQKHDLTSSAQHFNRLIAFNQIHEFLGIDRLSEDIAVAVVATEPSLKRPLDSEDLIGEVYSEDVVEANGDHPDSKKARLETEAPILETVESTAVQSGEGAEPMEGAELNNAD